jgi:hypothetical protein
MWECENCSEQCEEGETFCDDCVLIRDIYEWLRDRYRQEDMHDGQPDEMQDWSWQRHRTKWHDFNPDC